MSPDELRTQQLAQLKEAAKIFLRPMERLPFPVVVEAMTGKVILPMASWPDAQTVLHTLADACIHVVAASTATPVTANRPNDVSTEIEERLEQELPNLGIKVDRPTASSGRTPGGYPDRLLWHSEKPIYLEIKVSREENIDQGSARNFFYQPTAQSKIRHDAPHLLAGFAIREVAAKRWILTGWKLVDLWFLRVKLKPEYNADNLEIYREEAILLAGNNRKIVTRGPSVPL